MYIKNCWYVLAWDYEVKIGIPVQFFVINQPLVAYRTEAGDVVVLEDRCAHRLAPLSKGVCEVDAIRCMYHGLKYAPSGKCIEIPGQNKVPAALQVRKFPAVEKHSWLWVWMGEPELADEALIPPAIGLTDQNWILRSGRLDYNANYLLINDNLTDFSHLSFVHANSFGASEGFARFAPKVKRLERGIRVERWVLNPVRKEMEKPETNSLKTAMWQSYDYLIPGILLMLTAIYPEAVMNAAAGEPPADDIQPLRAIWSSQAVTPKTNHTTAYRFSAGPQANAPGGQAAAAAFEKVMLMAFAEDKDIIEAQQAMLDLDPSRGVNLIASDSGPVQMRRVIEQAIAAETVKTAG